MKLAALQECATAEMERLERHYQFAEDERARMLAHMTKITEEVGELAEQVLGHLQLQRGAKLKVLEKEHIKKELADVLYTTMILASSLDIDMEKVMEKRVAELRARHY